MNTEVFSNIFESAGTLGISYSIEQLIFLLGNSLIIGILLCIITFITSTPFLDGDESKKTTRIQLLYGTSHILFLCVGLTAVMILVNNNLARAFSIGAAIALVRFRIKLGKKSAGSNILFGIISGIACGLGEVTLAWMLVSVYLFLSILLFGMMKLFLR